MAYHIKRNLLIYFLFFASGIFFSCTDDLVPADNEKNEQQEIDNGYTIDVEITLDNMGGRAIADDNPLFEIENYIDPEKVRVLFFNHEDKFLFESRNRWVKALPGVTDENSENFNRWMISVPLYTYGNEEQWDWVTIREALTTADFKIAVLANRPDKVKFPGFTEGAPELNEYLDNRGPFWGPEQMLKKDVFDLHHCQYDYIYWQKNSAQGYYDFIAGTDPELGFTMGATSGWVDFEYTVNNKYPDAVKWEFRPAIHPSKENPIPMYGIQKFKAIPASKWEKGSPFNLSQAIPNLDEENSYDNPADRKSISLLRSVVKIELLIPKSLGKIDPVVIGYPNIYARCEPMDVWTPTNELWLGDDNDHETNCELDDIMKFGPVSRYNDNPNKGQGGTAEEQNLTSPEDYWKRMAWFYGAWLEKDWNFPKLGTAYVEGLKNSQLKFPRIFNTCIQRNSTIYIPSDLDVSKESDQYYHYVVYTGERNINDPSDLGGLGNAKSGQQPLIYWSFKVNNGNENDRYYYIPITDYSKTNNPAREITTYPVVQGTSEDASNNKPIIVSKEYQIHGIYWYMNAVQGCNWVKDPDKIGSTTGEYKGDYNMDYDCYPWPLIRNHVYRLTLGGSSTLSRGTAEEKINVVKSERLRTKDITLRRH